MGGKLKIRVAEKRIYDKNTMNFQLPGRFRSQVQLAGYVRPLDIFLLLS